MFGPGSATSRDACGTAHHHNMFFCSSAQPEDQASTPQLLKRLAASIACTESTDGVADVAGRESAVEAATVTRRLKSRAYDVLLGLNGVWLHAPSKQRLSC
jgi:hypothetical protein